MVGAKWNGEAWDVEVKDHKTQSVFHDQCDILINAGGVLNNWKWPAIPGIGEFKGTLMHSANWDSNVSLDGKTVGLIGNGYAFTQSHPSLILHRLIVYAQGTNQNDFIAPPASRFFLPYSQR